MKHPLQTGFKLLSFVFCIALSANVAQAGVSYWDPEGFLGSYNTYSGNTLAGTWENNSWATNTDHVAGSPADKGRPTTVAWTDGDAAVFAVGAGATNNVGGATNTTTFTVTMNANHTIAGIFDGTLGPKSCRVTIAGSGILTLSNGLDAFSVGNTTSDGSLGVVTVNVPLTGPGTLTPEGNGQIFLNASNSYSGGTQLGATNANFTGTLHFNSSNSFGTGPIVVSSGAANSIGALQCTNAGVTVTNRVDLSQSLTNVPFLNLVGNAAGVTYSGPWTCGTNAVNLGSGGAANQVIISGVISGTAGVTKFNPGSLIFAGPNTYSGGTVLNAGTLQVGNGGTSGNLGSGAIVDNTTATLSYKRSDTYTETNDISGGGALMQAGTGTLILSSVNNTYSGLTTISNGTLRLAAANNLPAASPVKVLGGGVFDVNSFSPTIAYLIGSGNVINNNATLTVNGNLTTAGNNNTYSCFSGVIGGSGNLTKQGSAAMALRGANTFSGGLVQLQGGTLSVGALPDRLPTGSAVVISSGIFQLDANNQIISALSGSGSVNLGGGTLTVNQGGSSTFSGVIQNSELAGSPTATGNGLRGYYYDNEDLTNLKAVRNDATVNFPNLTVTNDITGLPNAGIATNTFSIRWLGQVLTPNVSGSYTFTTTCDDGSRLWVNGTLVVDNWVDQGAIAKSGSVTLAAGTLYDIVLEYYNNGGPGSAVLSWTPPGGSSAVIPNGNLVLPGPGALVKLGGGSLNLSGVNTYTGPTIVGAGTLEISSANGLASGSVTVTNGATLKLDSSTALSAGTLLILNTNTGSPVVNLNYAGTSQIGLLSLDGGTTFLATGTWGPIGSGAAHTSSRFTGTGLLNVVTPCSQTNAIVGITDNGNKTFALKMLGTPGALYYLLSQTNVSQPMVNWKIVPGSSNQVFSVNGIWSFTVTNPAPAYYRVGAVTSCF